VILFPVLAEAQVQTGTPEPSLLIPLEPPEALPPSGTQGGYLFNLRPLGADLGHALADDGFYLVARNLSEGLGNVSGGLKRGGSFEGYTTLGFDLDIEKVAGITGGSIHFLLGDLQGQSYAGYSGSTNMNNRVFAGSGPAFRVNEFSYEQSLTSGSTCDLGRLPAYTQFDGSELYCMFITSLCRTLAVHSTGALHGPRSRRYGSLARSIPI
jgi:carbohydrate-selective porin OprB